MSLLDAVGAEQRGPAHSWFVHQVNHNGGRSLMDGQRPKGKSFDISKWEVRRAYLKVAANKGAAGVDGVDLEVFESDLDNNLYRIWNRMSSGSYFPPPVKAVEIPKPHGCGMRMLGVPTIGDRIAQTVVAARIEAVVEPKFHPDSYGYRPGKSQIDAVGACRERCWRYDWVVEFDLRKFFDTVPHDRVLAAVEANTDLPWVVLYVRRWLTAPIQRPDGHLAQRGCGTPQGSAVSPVLANLFLHYALDLWLGREFPDCPWERYADDAVVHCRTRAQAEAVLAALRQRMEQVGLALHPDKTNIVYCRDGRRTGSWEGPTSFTFLGFTFRARSVQDKYRRRLSGFNPAVSDDALKKMSAEVRSWQLHRRTNLTEWELARAINPIVTGWMTYYGSFYRSALYPLLARINYYLVRWSRKKFKRLGTWKSAMRQWRRIQRQYPRFFAQWQWVTGVWW